MLNLRIYRAAFVPVLLALAVVAFSLTDGERGIATSLAPDAFDGQAAMGQLQDLDRRFAERSPGSPADDALAGEVARRLRASLVPDDASRGVAPATVRAVSEDVRTPDGRRRVQTVIAERPGGTDGRIVVVADRSPSASGPAALSGTAALLELGRVFSGRATRRTLTLVSTSGGPAAARAALDDLGGTPSVALVLGDLASREPRRPQVIAWSNGSALASPRLTSTVRSAVRAEAGVDPGAPGAAVQWARLAVPGTLTGQGPLVRAGIPAVALQVSGERGPPPTAAVSERRLRAYGRAALRSVSALDEARALPAGHAEGIQVQRKTLPSWAVRLLTGALLFPLLLAAIDGLARARRRRSPILPWVRWLAVAGLPFLAVGAFAVLLGLTGLLPAAPPVPVTSGAVPVEPLALAATGVVALLAWFVLRPLAHRVLGVDGPPSETGAAAVLGVGLALVTTAVWIVNPYAAALLLPAAHLWLLVVGLPEAPPRAAALLAWLAGAGPIALVALHYARAWHLDPVEVTWTALLAVAGGHVGPLGIVAWSAVLGCAAATAVIALHRRPALQEAPAVSVRGPLGYAGPGSLGGTESALRR